MFKEGLNRGEVNRLKSIVQIEVSDCRKTRGESESFVVVVTPTIGRSPFEYRAIEGKEGKEKSRDSGTACPLFKNNCLIATWTALTIGRCPC